MDADIETKKNESLFELAEILGQQNNFQEILRLIANKAASLFNSEIASVLMVNPQTNDTIKTIVREGGGIKSKSLQIIQSMTAGWVSKKRQSFLSADIQADPRFRKNVIKNTEIHSAICAPLHIEARTIGFILILDTHINEFNSKSLAFLEKLASIAAPFLSNMHKIENYFKVPLPGSALLAKYEQLGLLGKGEKFIELLTAVEAAAQCDVRVILEGKSGTGKELIARAIHNISSRCQQPFIAIDCGAVPDNLIESELFGHVKGAYTGASSDRRGLFEEADRGTLFMDEINNLPYNMQAKLMRVLQEGEIRPLGDNRSRKVNVRIISASSVQLRNLVQDQIFREDLFYRLNVYPISVPDLNERREDISILSNHFLKQFSHEQKKEVKSFHPLLLNFMKQLEWPGNIRELRNFIERLVTLCPAENDALDIDILPQEYREDFMRINTINKTPVPLQKRVSEFEEQIIRQVLSDTNWNQLKASRKLSISERTLRYKMKKLQIIRPNK